MGPVRHYWVVVKLLITVVATIVLLMYTQTLASMTEVARESSSASGDVSSVRNPSPVLHAGVALVLLVVATTLAVYKPRGLTRYGWRKEHRSGPAAAP